MVERMLANLYASMDSLSEPGGLEQYAAIFSYTAGALAFISQRKSVLSREHFAELLQVPPLHCVDRFLLILHE